jgi:EAL domain-containing protein (putative c-di-GMP-specific phosphodiesterase class I)
MTEFEDDDVRTPVEAAGGARSGPWSIVQAATVAEAEAIAANAAAEVAAEAAATARAAVNVASAAAERAAEKASDVAAQAVSAAAAAGSLDAGDDAPIRSAAAAAKVALSVASVAAAAAIAAIEAALVINEQLARDVAATATAVTLASSGDLAAIPEATVLAGYVLEDDGPSGDPFTEELRSGILHGQLRLDYQPIIALATSQPMGVEALVRWQHPTRGLLAPLEFIGIAERNGLIGALGEWVLSEACRVAAAMPTRSDLPLTIGVNLSGRQLSDGKIVDTVRAALDATGCRAERLMFEITETAFVTDMSVAVRSLRGLKALGASLAIDDFGTGYSTLQYLRQLPADVLKIDRSFISGMVDSSDDAALVASVISLAHNVNVTCIAEGVETLAQLRLLEQLGCDFAQGYLFSPPVDEVALGSWLDDHTQAPRRKGRAPSQASPESARIMAMHQHGSSPHTIAAALNIDGSRTTRARRWSAESVSQVIARSPQR